MGKIDSGSTLCKKFFRLKGLSRSRYVVERRAGKRSVVLRQKPNISIIDKGLSIEGRIVSNGRVIIKGSMNGTIQGETVIIAEGGFVEGDVMAQHMTVSGSFDGILNVSEQLMVLSSARCSGKIICGHLVVEAGAVIDAEVNSGIAEFNRTEEQPVASVVAL